MTTLLELAKKLHNTLALYNGAGHALGWKTEKVDKLLDESKRVIELATQPAPVQQEPVAAQSVMTVRIWRDKNSDQNAEFKNWHKLPDGEHILYTSPQPAQQEPEPFGYFKAEPFGWTDCAATDEGAVALYEHPPAQRKPLTDEEIGLMHNTHLRNGGTIQRFARAIEAAHGIKENTCLANTAGNPSGNTSTITSTNAHGATRSLLP